MLQTKLFSLHKNSVITKTILTEFIKLFWSEIFKPLHDKNNNIHLMLICKVQFADSTIGYRTLADLRRVNFNDMELFIEYICERLGILSDSYTVNPVSKIAFTYIMREGKASGDRALLNQPVYEVTTHNFNNMQLPLSIDPLKYGKLLSQTVINDNTTKYVLINKDLVFVIDATKDSQGLITQHVQIEGSMDLKWIDKKISETIFLR